MPKACLTCAQDPNNPCFGILIEFTTPIGSVITKTDTVKILTKATASTAGLVEVAPFINQNSNDEYFYQFNIIVDNEVKNFVIYKNTSFWTVAQQESPNSAIYITYSTTPVLNINSECIFEDITENASWTNVSGDNVTPNLNISSVKQAILVPPSENVDSCDPPINVPIDVSGNTISTKIDTLYKCLESKGTDYLNKLKSGIACSNIELIKLSLILDLLKRKDCNSALPCLYNKREFPVTLYKGDSCSSLDLISGNTIILPGNFIGYTGANFNISCGSTPNYSQEVILGGLQTCDGCPGGYVANVDNTYQAVCNEQTTTNATVTPANAATATLSGGDTNIVYNQGGLNLHQDITEYLDDLPITFNGTGLANYKFITASGNDIPKEGGVYSKNNNYQFVQANNPLFTTITGISNSAHTQSSSRGRLNNTGTWINSSNLDCTSNPSIPNCDNAGKYIELYKCFVITGEARQYLIGISADNAAKIEIKGPGFGDGQTFTEVIRFSSNSSQHTDNFIWYHILPITLSTGSYTFRIRGYNYSDDSAVSVDIYDSSVENFKTLFCNNNLFPYTTLPATYTAGDVVNATNLTAKQNLLNSYRVFSLRDNINQTVFTQSVSYSCPLGAELDYCANPTTPSCTTITNTIPYYHCCDEEACQDSFDGLSLEIIDIEYNSDLDISTLYLSDTLPIGPGNTCINYCISYSPTSETYLQTFLKYIGKQCSECLNRVALKNNYSNFDIVDRVPAAPSPKVVSPNGTPITFENGLDLTL
jgi:hypothetical protein